MDFERGWILIFVEVTQKNGILSKSTRSKSTRWKFIFLILINLFYNFFQFFLFIFYLFFTITITPNPYPRLVSGSEIWLGGFWTCPELILHLFYTKFVNCRKIEIFRVAVLYMNLFVMLRLLCTTIENLWKAQTMLT